MACSRRNQQRAQQPTRCGDEPFTLKLRFRFASLIFFCFLSRNRWRARRSYQTAGRICWRPQRQRYNSHSQSVSALVISAVFFLLLMCDCVNVPQEKSGGLAGIFKKSPKPAPRSIATKVTRAEDLHTNWAKMRRKKHRKKN